MYEMAKKARESLRSKAKKLASEPSSKVDSSDWTPAEPLNADVKTGMRPVSRRAYKSGGKVSGECEPMRADRKPRKSGGRSEATEYALAKVNRNVKDANEEREGIKHVGGLKRGGRAEKETGGGLFMNGRRIPSATAGKPIVDKTEQRASTPAEIKRAEAHMSQMGKSVSTDKGMSADEARKFLEGRKDGGRTKKMMGGPMMDPRMSMVKDKLLDFGGKGITPGVSAMKKGGKAEHADEAMDKALIKKMVKPEARSVKKHGGETHADEAMDKALIKKMVKPEARTKRATGGSVENHKPHKTDGPFTYPEKDFDDLSSTSAEVRMKKAERMARKDGGRAKGKTDINIVIAAGQRPDMGQPGMPPMPGGRPGSIPIPAPAPGAPAGGMPMPMPMPMPGPAAGPAPGGMPMPPLPRKSGGRTMSYKDMTAGSGSGEGRLQKTQIEKRHTDAPARATGGKVGHRTYRSYQDMDAGAGSGFGRLEKAEIEKRKRVR